MARQGVHFGLSEIVDRLIERFERHFEGASLNETSAGEVSLVVGLYGPWGCSKTTWLREIEGRVRQRSSRVLRGIGEPRVTTIPVRFNAWQFEREEHLAVAFFCLSHAPS